MEQNGTSNSEKRSQLKTQGNKAIIPTTKPSKTAINQQTQYNYNSVQSATPPGTQLNRRLGTATQLRLKQQHLAKPQTSKPQQLNEIN